MYILIRLNRLNSSIPLKQIWHCQITLFSSATELVFPEDFDTIVFCIVLYCIVLQILSIQLPARSSVVSLAASSISVFDAILFIFYIHSLSISHVMCTASLVQTCVFVFEIVERIYFDR